MAAAGPPRPFLTVDQIRALSKEEQKVAIAEWSSYNARMRLERQEEQQRDTRGRYRGGRARGGRGRGRGGYRGGYYGSQPGDPYPTARPNPRPFTNISATFTEPARQTNFFATNESPSTSSIPKVGVVTKADPCPTFTATGLCKRTRCHYSHDPDKTAICKKFLFKGICSLGDSCSLSHEPSPNRSPHCMHFQADQCNKEDCRYAHIHVSTNAPVCEAFARLGYCEKGDLCADRHAFECPDFTNKGTCEVKGCRMAHVVHAGRLRKARLPSSEADSSTTLSPEKGTVPDAGNDAIQQDEPGNKPDDVDQTHALTQQADYIAFES